MKVFRTILACLLGMLLPAAAAAECGGTDLLAALEKEDAEEHAALFEAAGQYRHARGKLWEVSRPGIEPSVILGTYHDTGIAEEPLPAAAVHALDRARALVVEISPEEQDKLQKRIATDPTFAFNPEGGGWVELLSPEQKELAEEALSKRGLDLRGASTMRPWMLMSVLGVPQCQLAAMASGKPVLDTLLVHRAIDQGTPVVGLEGYEDAIAAFGRIDLDELKSLAVDMLAQVDGEEDARATMIELYRDGEIGALLEFGIWQSSAFTSEERAREIAEIFREAIISDRNHEWMDTLEAELEKGNAFVAFGALHLIGEEGVLALLEERGWNLLRLDG